MFGEFDARERGPFFERHRTQAASLTLASCGTLVWWMLGRAEPKLEIDVELEPEIENLAPQAEEPEPELEPEPEVEAAPQRDLRPRPRPKLQPPTQKVTETPQETTQPKPSGGPSGPGSGSGGGPKRPAPAPDPTPERPKPEPKAPPPPKVDPTKPIDRPEQATLPTPLANNPVPEYPSQLRDKGITGEVVLKVQINRDGSLGKVKVLRETNTATGEDDQKRAHLLFLIAVRDAVKHWKYTPAKLNGEPITVWHMVRIPFSLTPG